MNKEFADSLLSIKLGENDADAATVGEYMRELLRTLLVEEESFSGKRPFGNSGWQYEFMLPIREADLFSEDTTNDEIFDALMSAIFGDY